MIKLNGVQVPVTIFPDGTSQVWKLPEGLIQPFHNKVVWEFENEGEFMHLAQLRRLVSPDTDLYLPYLPYGRQDKEVSNSATFALRPFLVLLRVLDFCWVRVFDPHNPALLEQVLGDSTIVMEPKGEILAAIKDCDPDVVLFPDWGARQRYTHLVEGVWTAYAEKTRNQATGEITGLALHGQVAGKVLIVDDICDGGMTFIKLAEKLYEEGAKEVHLYVSHGLFTKGLQVLRDAGIKRIFTKNGEVK